MELLTNRYRNLAALAAVIIAQLLLLGYQVKTRQDVRLIRIWAVTAVTPLARVLESVRAGAASVLDNYIRLVHVQQENLRLKEEVGRLKLEAQHLQAELATAERAEALSLFRKRNPSKMIAARIIGAGTGSGSRVVFVDRGSVDGVARGMAVTTPDGIVGRVSAAYPTASQVILVTDAGFAAGVISQAGGVQGTLKGAGPGRCRVEYIPNEQKVEVGEWFYTSGDDRVFPRGLPVGPVKAVGEGKTFLDILIQPAGLKEGLEEVLVVLEGVHQPLRPAAGGTPPAALLPPPPAATGEAEESTAGSFSDALNTEADLLRERYRRIGEAQGHVFGEGAPGSRPPDFNRQPAEPEPVPAAPAPASTEQQSAPAPRQ